MQFEELGLPAHPLLDEQPYNNNQSLRLKKLWISVGGICLTIMIIALIVSVLFIHMTQRQEKPLPIHELIIPTKATTSIKFNTTLTTVFSTTTTELELSSKSSLMTYYSILQ
jgi:hypothetical protein